MLTRLKVAGFKNLFDTEVHLGAFTCIGGPNAVGKSNFFDAIRFLSLLANNDLNEAASKIRNDDGRSFNVKNLFFKYGRYVSPKITFEADMIVPSEGLDEWGQSPEASITFLRYKLVIGLNTESPTNQIIVEEEELTRIKVGDASKLLKFDHNPRWRKSVIKGRRTSPFISSFSHDGKIAIGIHQDQEKGRPYRRPAEKLKRTILSSATSAEYPTAYLARQEMMSWRFLSLEPSALRRPDEFKDMNKTISKSGAHMPATLFRLAGEGQRTGLPDPKAYLAGRLSALVDDILSLDIEVDDKRELLTLIVKDKSNSEHPAHALSDGTLRFLALALMEIDPETTGLVGLEEPENGIHPDRIGAIVELLQDMSMDTHEEVSAVNPFRQVLINTHSPLVVMEIERGDILVAETRESIAPSGERVKGVVFNPIVGTWRAKQASPLKPVSVAKLLSYLYNKNVKFVETHRGKSMSILETPQGKGRKIKDLIKDH